MNRLYRSRRTRIIAGVAGGLADYFEVDVVLVRLLWVVSAFVGGGGILAYIIAWIIIPEERPFATGEQKDATIVYSDEGGEKYIGSGEEQASQRRRRNAGLLLIGLGLIFLTRQFFGVLFYYFWPLLIIAAGVYLLTRNGRETGR